MNLFMKFVIHGKAGICYDKTYCRQQVPYGRHEKTHCRRQVPDGRHEKDEHD